MDRSAREAVAARVLALSGAGATEVIVGATDEALTRFTRNAIHQNVASSDAAVRVRTVVDGRTGVASTNDLSAPSLERAYARACTLARHAPRNETGVEMVQAAPVAQPGGAFSAATAAATAAQRAEIARGVFEVARQRDLWAAGFVMTSRFGITIANTRGTLQSFEGTECGLSVKQNGADSTGYAERFSIDVGDLDGAATGAAAADKAIASAGPVDVPAREWTVILEPAAAAELIAFLASHFSAQNYDEGSSFFSGHLGDRFAGENVSIADDAAHALNPGRPFDLEGAPTQRVALFDRGVARDIVTDAQWARRMGRPNTGHALAEPNSTGPSARHLVVAPGSASLDDLISNTPSGLLVSRLWYTRTVDQRRTIVTGMTRDGTFLIENGRIGKGVHNLRFNQSIVDALGDAEFGRDLARTSSYSYSLVLPAIKFGRFSFTSATDF